MNEPCMKYGDMPKGMRLTVGNMPVAKRDSGGAPPASKEGYSKEVVLIDNNGVKIKKYVSAIEAAEDLKCSRCGISQCCTGKLKKHKGMIFIFAEDYRS